MMHAVLSSHEELLNDLGGDGNNINSTGIVMNVFGRSMEAYAFPWWSSRVHLGRDRMIYMGEKLWEESVNLLQSLGYHI